MTLFSGDCGRISSVGDRPTPQTTPNRWQQLSEWLIIQEALMLLHCIFLLKLPPLFFSLLYLNNLKGLRFRILDEDEMYDKGIPFSTTELISIAKFCNFFCFRVIWNNLTSVENTEGTLFGTIHSLTQLLYSRDCRRQFTNSPKFWLSPDVKSPALISEYEKKTARGLLIMEKMSHCISIRDRMLLFRKMVNEEKVTIDGPPSLITVVRTRLIEDGYHHLSNWPPQKLKTTIRVKFVNQQGLEEAGIDQDGVFKEFLELTLKQVFAPTLNLFTCTSAGVLYPSPTSYIHENHLALFQFVGRLLAKAVYEGIVVDVQLAPVLLSAVSDSFLLWVNIKFRFLEVLKTTFVPLMNFHSWTQNCTRTLRL